MKTIALDIMGADEGVAPAVLAGAELSLAQEAGIILVGDQSKVDPILRRTAYDGGYLTVVHAPDYVTMTEKPREALLAKPDASIHSAARLVADGHADALVTAGNTGACILACDEHFTKLPGVPRTALAAVFPTERRRGQNEDPFSLILDVGATLSVSPDALVAFAHMGSAYASCISRNERPTVALLSNGSEPNKGLPEIIEANRLLSADPRINFIGNIEGIDLPRGRADVVVTSGFTGNVVLKMLEGMNEAVSDLARYAYRSKLIWRLGLMMLRGGLLQLKNLTDWRQYGGAPILGFDQLAIKAHGRSNQRAFANAVKVAHRAAKGDLCSRIGDVLRIEEDEHR